MGGRGGQEIGVLRAAFRRLPDGGGMGGRGDEETGVLRAACTLLPSSLLSGRSEDTHTPQCLPACLPLFCDSILLLVFTAVKHSTHGALTERGGDKQGSGSGCNSGTFQAPRDLIISVVPAE